MGVKFLQVQTKGETRSGDSTLKGGKRIEENSLGNSQARPEFRFVLKERKERETITRHGTNMDGTRVRE